MTQKPSSLSPDQKSMQAVAFPEDTTREPWYQRLRNWLWGYDFFISYHWASGGAYAVKLAAQLREKGYEVFLDRGEYAMGDKWKGVGEVALRNTQRLVLIATREAVFESEPVQHEVVNFTNRSRHCIPIFFGDTFVSDEKENTGKHIVLDRLPDDTLYIEDTAENLTASPAPHVVEKLESAHGIMRRRKLRLTITLISASLLAAFAVFASISWVNALSSRNEARRQEGIAKGERMKAEDRLNLSERQNAEMTLQNGYRSIHTEHDIAAGVLWYAKTLETTGPLAEPLRHSARSLIGGWSRTLPRHSLVHDKPIHAITFSLDGRYLVTANGDSTARLWNVATQDLMEQPLAHGGQVNAVSFSPDNQTVATASDDKTVRLWNTQTAKQQGEPLIHEGKVDAVLFSPNGRLLATIASGKAHLWSVQRGDRSSVSIGHDRVFAVCFSPDSQTLATANHQKTAMLWDAESGKPRGEALQHDTYIQSMTFTLDSRTLVTGTWGRPLSRGSVWLWDAKTSGLRREPFRNDGDIVDMKACSDEHAIVTLSDRGEVRVWDTLMAQPDGKRLECENPIHTIAVSSDRQTLATATVESLEDERELIQLWDMNTLQRKEARFLHTALVKHMEFSPDGHMLATAYEDHSVKLWDARPQDTDCSLLKHEYNVGSVDFSRDGRMLATASNNGSLDSTEGEVVIWSTDTGKRQVTLKSADVSGVVFSPDGNEIATTFEAYASSVVQLLDVKTLLLKAPLVHDAVVNAVSFSPDGSTLAVATGQFSDHGEVLLWDLGAGQKRDQRLIYDSDVSCVAFSPDGRLLAATSGKAAQLWHAASGQKNGEPVNHDDKVTLVAFSPNGQTFVTATDKGILVKRGEVQFWDASTGRPLGKPLIHDDEVTSLSFSSDGRTLCTASLDKTVRLWDVATGQPRGESFRHEHGVNAVSLSPDGQVFASSDYNTVRLWRLSPSIVDDAERVRLSVETRTGRTIENGLVRTLSMAEWRERILKLSLLNMDLMHR